MTPFILNHTALSLTSSLSMKYMGNLVTDTHFDTRDRMGRFITFVARLLRDVWAGDRAWGIAVDEETALLIDGFVRGNDLV